MREAAPGQQLRAWFGIVLLSIAWATTASGQTLLARVPAVSQSAGGIQAELTANQQKWTANGSDDYRYRMQRSCFCPPEVTTPGLVEVRGGSIVGVSAVGAPDALDPNQYLTVEGLFAVIQAAIDGGAHEIRASWDPQLGYPTELYIDFLFPAVDDEIAYTASDLVLGTGYDAEQQALDEALAAWNAAGLAHYRFRMQRSCFCSPQFTAPGLVEVLDGAIVSVTDPMTGDPLSAADYLTVVDLFEVAQVAIDSGVWMFSAAYDPVLGYPTEIGIDAEEFLADDTTAYAASELVALPEPKASCLGFGAALALGVLARRRTLPKCGIPVSR